MPLTPTQQDGVWSVSGVTGAAAQWTLGRRAFQAGPHIVGFDDSFAEPLVMNAFFDLTADPYSVKLVFAKTFTYIGYMQFCRLRYRGNQPIRPSVYGGRLADRDVYLTSDGWFADMMGPSDASLRNVTMPFYAYNGMLADGTIRRVEDLYLHPRPNGSLRNAPATTTNQSLYASIFAEVSTGLVTPAAVAPYAARAKVILTIPTTPAVLAATEGYRIAFDALTGSGGSLAGLTESQVAARVVGPYVLLALPDDEDYGPTLCVTVEGTTASPAVVVRLLTYYDVEEMEADAGSGALRRMAAAVTPMTDDTPMTDATPARGRAGLLPTPVASPSEFVLALDHVTMAVGLTPHDTTPLWPLSGFSWSVLFQFDEDTGTLDSTAVTQPRPEAPFDVRPAVAAFAAAVRNQPTATIDTSSFTAAALRRDNFAAGRKLRFVDATGTDV